MMFMRLYAETLFVPPVPTLIFVLPRTRFNDTSSADSPPIARLTVTRTLLVELDGVMLTEKPEISDMDALVVVVTELSTVWTSCKVRNAPRRLFSDDAGSAVASVKDAGSVVGVAMSVLDDEVGATKKASSDDEWIRESDGAVDGCDPTVRGDGVLD